MVPTILPIGSSVLIIKSSLMPLRLLTTSVPSNIKILLHLSLDFLPSVTLPLLVPILKSIELYLIKSVSPLPLPKNIHLPTLPPSQYHLVFPLLSLQHVPLLLITLVSYKTTLFTLIGNPHYSRTMIRC
jgi:hypothetical protein